MKFKQFAFLGLSLLGPIQATGARGDSAVQLNLIPGQWGQSCEGFTDTVAIGASAGVMKCAKVAASSQSCVVQIHDLNAGESSCDITHFQVGVYAVAGEVLGGENSTVGNCPLRISEVPGWSYRECNAAKGQVVIAESGGFVRCAILSLE
jgi:hypothetical protein